MFKKLKEHAGNFVVALGEVVLGILLLINPVGVSKMVITVVGVVLCLAGVINIVRYARVNPVEGVVSQRLFTGLLEILLGGFLSLRADWLLSTFPVLTVVYGVGVLVLGVRKFAGAIDLMRLKRGVWRWMMVSAVVTLLCAVLILANPFASVAALWIFIGVSLIVEAVADGMSVFMPGSR